MSRFFSGATAVLGSSGMARKTQTRRPLTLVVNGETRHLELTTSETLLDVVRERLRREYLFIAGGSALRSSCR